MDKSHTFIANKGIIKDSGTKTFYFNPEKKYELVLSELIVQDMKRLNISKTDVEEFEKFFSIIKDGDFVGASKVYTFFDTGDNCGTVILLQKYAIHFFVDGEAVYFREIRSKDETLKRMSRKSIAIKTPVKDIVSKKLSEKDAILFGIKPKTQRVKVKGPAKVIAPKVIKPGHSVDVVGKIKPFNGVAKPLIKKDSMVAHKKSDAFGRVTKRSQKRNIEVDK